MSAFQPSTDQRQGNHQQTYFNKTHFRLNFQMDNSSRHLERGVSETLQGFSPMISRGLNIQPSFTPIAKEKSRRSSEVYRFWKGLCQQRGVDSHSSDRQGVSPVSRISPVGNLGETKIFGPQRNKTPTNLRMRHEVISQFNYYTIINEFKKEEQIRKSFSPLTNKSG